MIAVAAAIVVETLQAALAVPGARLEVERFDAPAKCVPAALEAVRPVQASGRVALRVRGEGCPGWAWAEVRVFANALVAKKQIVEGELLKDAVDHQEREVTVGHAFLTELFDGAKAARTIAKGTAIEEHLAARAGALKPGASVQVEVHAGALVLVQPARVASCARGAACAVLPSGKRVEGRLVAGRIIVEAP